MDMIRVFPAWVESLHEGARCVSAFGQTIQLGIVTRFVRGARRVPANPHPLSLLWATRRDEKGEGVCYVGLEILEGHVARRWATSDCWWRLTNMLM